MKLKSFEAAKNELRELCEKRGVPELINRRIVISGLPDYERTIEDLLKSIDDGCAFQSDIVRATDISTSKVSCVLATLLRKGKIEKIKYGRENLIRYCAQCGGDKNGN